jgi:hypothetical protein
MKTAHPFHHAAAWLLLRVFRGAALGLLLGAGSVALGSFVLFLSESPHPNPETLSSWLSIAVVPVRLCGFAGAVGGAVVGPSIEGAPSAQTGSLRGAVLGPLWGLGSATFLAHGNFDPPLIVLGSAYGLLCGLAGADLLNRMRRGSSTPRKTRPR